jgi:hypothetical protein
VADGLAGARGADPGDDRHVAADRLDDRLDHVVALLGSQQRKLAVGPEREDPVCAAVDDEPCVGRGRLVVDRFVFVERGDRRRHDPADVERVVRTRLWCVAHTCRVGGRVLKPFRTAGIFRG